MKKIFFVLFLLIASFSFCEPSLEKFLENDLELKKLALELNKEKLKSQETSIDNGFDIQLSTGTATFQFSDQQTSISFKPSATIKLPQASNLSLTAATDISIKDNETTLKDSSISLSADIISGNLTTRKINLLTAEHNLLSAKRKLQNRALEAEKEYYTQLKNLYNTASNIISKQKDLYDDTISFEEIKAKGFSKSSSKYRQAEMKVMSARHEVETKIHDMDHDCAVFASKCDTKLAEKEKPFDFLPKKIPEVEPIDILSFPRTTYTKIADATYAQTLAELKRKADKDFTLSANAGYTFGNTKAKSSNDENSDTVDFGATAGYSGVSLNAGVSLPVTGDNHSPIYKISASVNPNKFRKTKIKNQTDEINIQEEKLSILSAIDAYETSVVDKQTELSDIQWSTKSNLETLDMFSTLESDLKKYLEAGVITQSEHLNAFANKEQYRIKHLIDCINLIIYNNETKLLFYRDEEISE